MATKRIKTIKPKKRILWADDDLFMLEPFIHRLDHAGYEVLTVRTGSDALDVVENQHKTLDLVILDVMMSPGEGLLSIDTFEGRRTGLVVAREIRKRFPSLPVVGLSIVRDPEVSEWFKEIGAGFLNKMEVIDTRDFMLEIERFMYRRKRRKPKCFIVHGHDHALLNELKDYIQNTLQFGKPVVLRDEPSLGRTIVEKFEDEARKADLVFVLLTPDDKAAPKRATDAVKRRARQNVVFELGFFYAKFQRRRGRVVLLHKGAVEVPSDISGVIYIDVSKGIPSAGELIRRELREWL